MLFCGYVLFDTQIILEKASAGSRDYLAHAADLFVDFIALFVRLCVILLRNAERKDERRSRENKNRR